MSTVCSCLYRSWTVLRTSAFHLLRSVWRVKHSGSSSNYWPWRMTMIALLLSQQDVQRSSCVYQEAWRRMLIFWLSGRWRVHCCTTGPRPCFYETSHCSFYDSLTDGREVAPTDWSGSGKAFSIDSVHFQWRFNSALSKSLDPLPVR